MWRRVECQYKEARGGKGGVLSLPEEAIPELWDSFAPSQERHSKIRKLDEDIVLRRVGEVIGNVGGNTCQQGLDHVFRLPCRHAREGFEGECRRRPTSETPSPPH